MRTYILKRILGVVPTVLMITLVVFVMMRSVPGDPVVPLLGDAYTEEDAIKVREAYGLNKPVLVQYAIWLGTRPGRLGHVDPERAAGAPGRAGPPAGHARAGRAVDGGGARHRHPRRDHRRAATQHLGRLHGDLGGHDRCTHTRVLHRLPAAPVLLFR